MFGNDDFDFDEDFLKDADDKAITYYSQRDSHGEASNAKKRKLDEHNDSLFSLDDSFDKDWSVSKNDDKQLPHDKETKSNSGKNLILGIFNKNSVTERESQVNCDKLQKTIKQIPSETTVSQQQSARSQRGNLVLGILQKAQLQTEKIWPDASYANETAPLSCSTERKRNEQCHVSKPQYGNFNMDSPVCQVPRILCTEVTKNSSHIIPTTNCSNENHPPYKTSDKAEYVQQNTHDNTRRQLLLEALKPSTSANIESVGHTFQQPVIKIEKLPSEKVALVRKFPGPAGLLPDIMDGSVPPISYLKSLDENDNRSTDPTETKLTEYCSQNTKNLFTEGAWQLMLDDLPEDFLNGYEISRIKRMASENCSQSMKIQFLAGILERIDHSHDNPFVILKDFTDSIQGIIHRDIPLEYPGLLEPNVVILLHNTGLLRVSGSLLTNNYRILISPSQLLGIYTGKGKIIRTSRMKDVLGQHFGHTFDDDTNTSNELQTKRTLPKQNGNRINFSNINGHRKDMRHNENKLNLSQANEAQMVKTLSAYLEDETDNIFGDDVSRTSEKDADFGFTVSTRQITDLESEKNFTHMKNRSTDNMKICKLPEEQLPASNLKDTNKERNMSEANFNSISSEKHEESEISQKNIKTAQSEKKSLRSKLLQFKCNDVLTPPDANYCAAISGTDNVGPSKEEKSEKSSRHSSNQMDFASDILNDSDDDTDDAVLSQLDMDSILSNYNQQ